MYVCLCQAVTDGEVRDAIQSGCTELATLQEHLGVAVNCGGCAEGVRELLHSEAGGCAARKGAGVSHIRAGVPA